MLQRIQLISRYSYLVTTLVVQLGGSDRASLAPAARLVEEARGCDAIEINAGCPQACARKGRYGAFLMDDPARAKRIDLNPKRP